MPAYQKSIVSFDTAKIITIKKLNGEKSLNYNGKHRKYTTVSWTTLKYEREKKSDKHLICIITWRKNTFDTLADWHHTESNYNNERWARKKWKKLTIIVKMNVRLFVDWFGCGASVLKLLLL